MFLLIDSRTKDDSSTCHLCNKETSKKHKCQICLQWVHLVCGEPVGEEGCGQPVQAHAQGLKKGGARLKKCICVSRHCQI